ncbi:MAG: Asp-tRNA(Asn)/Glu-tRNA(Gln) amidotransferase subunit GatC [Patescibacteria group bacterium]|nr:Asp-tRNA(Asn)/Glu-tRNA(Gln) amidotransferase subunit GatC [Patescibacteria group bacterium]
MKISKKEVKHIASLARLDLTEPEKNKFSQELTSVIDYIDQLKKIKTKKTKPLYQTGVSANNTARDRVNQSSNQDNIKKEFPEEEDDYLKINKVFE